MLYPLKFQPQLKPVLWGGDEICRFKRLPPRDGIGESWELSGVQGHVSVVSNGSLQGKSLTELLATYGERLLGKAVAERFGTTFPLLIKFIDAKQPLSIQVHPNDAWAKKRHDAFGKTEMWYVVHAAPGASLFSGFARAMDADTYLQSLQDDTFTDYLQKHAVAPGDVFFLPAGRVHAIGAGCFIAEIQQTSDITYRIYDYNRKDANGLPRELHTGWAKDVIDYQVYDHYKTEYQAEEMSCQNLVRCPYFDTQLISGKAGGDMTLSYPVLDSFVILICLNGDLTVTDNQNTTVTLTQGETVLIPAAHIHPLRLAFSQDSQLLETFIDP
jgi:mannose-6-phosphate isomerase